MPFIDKRVLKKKVEAATAAEHPLLKEMDVDVATKTAYVQGCALATLIDDEKISEAERTIVRGIGLSFRLTEAEIEECFSVVSSLSNDEEKSQFVEEITTILQKDVVGRFFMEDFEKVAKTNGEPTGDVIELIDYVGALIYKDADWRSKKMAEEEQRHQEKARIEAEEKQKIKEEEERRKREEKARQEEEKKKKAAALASSFYPKVMKYMDAYSGECSLSEYSWNKIKEDLTQEELNKVPIVDALKAIETAYTKAHKDIHDIQMIDDHDKLIVTVWNAWAKNVALLVCAVCCLQKNLTSTDKALLNELIKHAISSDDGCGWFDVTDMLKACISEVLDINVDQLKISYS